MEPLGINLGLGLTELLILMVLLGLPVISLIDLARKRLAGIPLALWVLTICAVPFLGSVAYWIIRPTAESKD